MDPCEISVTLQKHEIIVRRRAWRKVLWQLTPLAAGVEDVEDSIEKLATPVGLVLAQWRHQRFDQPPLFIGRVRWIAIRLMVVPRSIFCCPHRCPRRINSSERIESQVIPMTQVFIGQALRVFPYQIESQGFSNQSEYDSSSMLEVEASMDGKTLFS